jgi:Holliday junction resolvase RusA-like endonuclease
VIYIEVPSVPISVNHAYARKRGGGRILTPEGKAYKNETKTHIARVYPEALKFFKADVPYSLVIEFTFHGRDEILTKMWPGKAKSRYKKLDVSNRLKLFEDALAAATGLDDSQNFNVTVAKAWHRDYAMTRVWVWNRDEEGSPIDDLIHRLKVEQQQARSAQPH